MLEAILFNWFIRKVLLNHNKSEIETGLNEDELLFAKIIRDADKLDIITHAITEYDFESVFWYSEFNCEEINEELIKIMFENHTLDYSKIKNNADLILSFYNMIYDLNFKSSLKELSDNKALNIFTNRIYENFNSDWHVCILSASIWIYSKLFKSKYLKWKLIISKMKLWVFYFYEQ